MVKYEISKDTTLRLKTFSVETIQQRGRTGEESKGCLKRTLGIKLFSESVLWDRVRDEVPDSIL